MQDILFEYELNPTTWVYLSALMTIGIYFKFRRFWSLRNLDLIALVACSPGLLLVYHGVKRQLEAQAELGRWLEQLGYIWLFAVAAFFLIRLLLDSIVVRRPLLEPNLSAGGLTFTGIALLVFLIANVVNPRPVHRLEDVLVEQESRQPSEHDADEALFHRLADLSEETVAAGRIAVIVAHLAVVLGMVVIGYRHFDNIHTGVATATLYLLLPYTAQMTSRADHAVPAALLVWAVASYRRPAVAGILIGLACAILYPLFLLPLWCGFYWRRGLFRFLIGWACAAAVLAVCLLLVPGAWASLAAQLRELFSLTGTSQGSPAGFWGYHVAVFRIPVMAAFVALSGSLALWPAEKNLGTLLSCSAAVMLASQFWHVPYGSLYMGWYLPLLLLTVFRPNLEDRVSVSALPEAWLPWRSSRPTAPQTA